MPDLGSSHPWPDGLEALLDSLRQGSVVGEVAAAFQVVVGCRLWSGEADVVGLPNHPEGVALISEPDITLGMVVTQSCDLVKRDNPWATFVPVYEATNRISENQARSAERGQTAHFRRLTAEWASEGLWVADLRLEVSVEKSLLLGKTQLPGFKNEVDYAELATHLSNRRERPAIDDHIIDHFIEPFFATLNAKDSGTESMRKGIREFRLQHSRLAPDYHYVTLFVVQDAGFGPDHSDWVASTVNEIRLDAQSHGIEILDLQCPTLDGMTATEYLTSKPIDGASS